MLLPVVEDILVTYDVLSDSFLWQPSVGSCLGDVQGE